MLKGLLPQSPIQVLVILGLVVLGLLAYASSIFIIAKIQNYRLTKTIAELERKNDSI